VVRHAGHGAGLQRRGADLFERQHAEHFAKAFDFTVKQRQQRFRRLIASVKPVPPVISTTCTSSLAIHAETWARMA
jgi:carbamate kinase